MFSYLFKKDKSRKPVKKSKDSMNVQGKTNAELHEQLLEAGDSPAMKKYVRQLAKDAGASDELLKML